MQNTLGPTFDGSWLLTVPHYSYRSVAKFVLPRNDGAKVDDNDTTAFSKFHSELLFSTEQFPHSTMVGGFDLLADRESVAG